MRVKNMEKIIEVLNPLETQRGENHSDLLDESKPEK